MYGIFFQKTPSNEICTLRPIQSICVVFQSRQRVMKMAWCLIHSAEQVQHSSQRVIWGDDLSGSIFHNGIWNLRCEGARHCYEGLRADARIELSIITQALTARLPNALRLDDC
jgi:hypothetical protein